MHGHIIGYLTSIFFAIIMFFANKLVYSALVKCKEFTKGVLYKFGLVHSFALYIVL